MVNAVHEPIVSITAVGAGARALFEGHEVADSDRALFLKELGRPVVCYFPAEDVRTEVLRRNDHVTSSPWGGVTTWYTITRDAKIVEDVAWSYADPYDEAAVIAGYIAFSPEHIELQVDEPARVPHVPPHDPPYL